MVDYREILKLQNLNYNKTQIAEAIHSSRNTIRDVEDRAQQQGIHWPLEESLTNQKLYELLYPERMEKAQVYMMPDCVYFVKRKSLKSEKLFPVFGMGIPHNRKDHVSSGCTAV